jgi:nucleoside 2-deoxyribosyltransferase
MITLYTAGSMEFSNTDDQTGWRDQVEWALRDHAVCLHPTRRIHSGDPTLFKWIFDMDMLDVQRADIVLADLRNSRLAKHGTAMEVFYSAYVLHKPVIAMRLPEDPPHPFFESIVTEWVHTPEAAIHRIIEGYL